MRPKQRYRIKLLKDRENLGNSKREATCNVQGSLIRISPNFPSEILRPEGSGILSKVLKEKKKSKLRILHSTKLSFKTQEEIKISPEKQKQREFITVTRPPL